MTRDDKLRITFSGYAVRSHIKAVASVVADFYDVEQDKIYVLGAPDYLAIQGFTADKKCWHIGDLVPRLRDALNNAASIAQDGDKGLQFSYGVAVSGMTFRDLCDNEKGMARSSGHTLVVTCHANDLK